MKIKFFDACFSVKHLCLVKQACQYIFRSVSDLGNYTSGSGIGLQKTSTGAFFGNHTSALKAGKHDCDGRIKHASHLQS